MNKRYHALIILFISFGCQKKIYNHKINFEISNQINVSTLLEKLRDTTNVEVERILYSNLDTSKGSFVVEEVDDKKTELQKRNGVLEFVIISKEIGNQLFLKKYSDNGVLRESSISLKGKFEIPSKNVTIYFNDVKVGKREFFNDSGVMFKTLNYDSLFRFSIDNLVKWLGKKYSEVEIRILQIYKENTSPHDREIFKPKIPYWNVVINQVENPSLNHILLINGTDGSLISSAPVTISGTL